MYVYQDDKLYLQTVDKTIIGVEIHPNSVIQVEGTETEIKRGCELLTSNEVYARFGILHGNSYIFPKEEVVKNEPTSKAKGTARKSK